MPSMPNDLVGIAVQFILFQVQGSVVNGVNQNEYPLELHPFLGDRVIFSPFEFMCEKKGSNGMRDPTLEMQA